MSFQIVGVLAAAAQGDADAESIARGVWIANNATQYNFLSDHSIKERKDASEAYAKNQSIQAAQKLTSLGGGRPA